MEAKLLEAIQSGNTPAFLAFLDQDPFILNRISLNSAENPLHLAALCGQTEIAQEIINRNPTFSTELNHDGFSPLHISVCRNQVEFVQEMLKIGRDLCLVKGKDGLIPLHCAVTKSRVDLLKEVVSACPEALREVTAFGESVLHLAVKSDKVESFRVLIDELRRLEMTEIANWKDMDGNAILHLATFNKQYQIISLLIGEEAIISGVETNSMNSSGFTAKDILDLTLQNKCNSHDIEILQIFHQSGAQNSQNLKTNPENINPPPPQTPQNRAPLFQIQSPCSSWNLWKELKKEIAESSMETKNALMVVAVLIATVTYQAILSPPSGFWSPEKGQGRSPLIGVQRRTVLPGEAVMASDPEVYAVFTVFNAIGFFSSLAMISLLTTGFPLRAGLRLAILSMAGTYMIAVIYMGPKKMKDVYLVVLVMGVLILVEFVRFFIWLLRKWGIVPQRNLFCDENRFRV